MARVKPAYTDLAQVASAVVACERCPRLRVWCTAVAAAGKREFAGQTYWGRPVPGFGDPRARLMVVGLAPAAHGGNRTGRVFTGDSSGDWLYEALHRHGFANQPHSVSRDDGMQLIDAYVTASGRCAPPDNKPTGTELNHCRPYLEAEIALLREVRVVVVLGRIAWEWWLRAAGWWARLAPAERPAFGHAAETVMADGVHLLCSYHPSRQNTNTGKLTRDMWHGIFRRARVILDAERGAAAKRPQKRVRAIGT